MNSELKNLMIAVTLSVLVMVGWQHFYEAPRREAFIQQQKAQQQKNKESGVTIPAENKAVGFAERKAVVNAKNRILIDNEMLHGSISTEGARFDDLVLKNYNKTIDKKGDYVELLSPSGTKEVYFAEFGWSSPDRNVKTPDSETVWQSSGGKLTVGAPLVLTWDNGQGLLFSKTISLDEHYMFTVKQSVKNNGNSDVKLAPYALLNRSMLEHSEYIISHEGAIGVFNEVLYEATYNDLMEEGKQNFSGAKGWIGIADKYWFASVIPARGTEFDANFSHNLVSGQHRYQADLVSAAVQVETGQVAENTYHFYAGAKKVDLLDEYGENLSIPLFDRAVDFGRLYFLTRPIFAVLKFFYNFLGNFGLAILLLTVCIRLILFPIANKGYISMNKLKELTPELTKLRERYKDDKVRLQQEMMALYKREKVNPMSGCLPILIQLPVFFALYKVLFITIEMRHAPFYGWIHDLSAPDPTSFINLFGLLPFGAPDFLQIGAWPFIMAITMFLQQKLNPPPPDPVQATMIKVLPFVFLFLFANFPAGLIIYWAWSNSLSILQQWVLAKVMPARRERKNKDR